MACAASCTSSPLSLSASDRPPSIQVRKKIKADSTEVYNILYLNSRDAMEQTFFYLHRRALYQKSLAWTVRNSRSLNSNHDRNAVGEQFWNTVGEQNGKCSHGPRLSSEAHVPRAPWRGRGPAGLAAGRASAARPWSLEVRGHPLLSVVWCHGPVHNTTTTVVGSRCCDALQERKSCWVQSGHSCSGSGGIASCASTPPSYQA